MALDQLKAASLAASTISLPTSTKKRTHVTVLTVLFLAATLVSIVISLHFLPLVIDDALISYRYSERLLQGKGLTWNDGEFVEGYSNLLWVLLVAAGGLFQANLISVGRILGLAANVATLASIPWAFARSPNASVSATLSGLLLIACSEAFAFWGIGGMETALVCAILSWGLATAYHATADRLTRTEICASLLFSLLAITRPDGILLGFGVGFGEVIRHGVIRATFRRAIGFVGLPLVFLGVQTAFRLAYYDSIVPNTASAKLAINSDRILAGISYVARGAMVNGAVLATMVAAGIVLWKTSRREPFRQIAPFFMPGLVWLAYICVIGGDWFPFERHWQPALICFTFASSGILSMLRPVRPRMLALLAAAMLGLDVAAQAAVNPYLVQFDKDKLARFYEQLRTELRRVDPSGAAERESLSKPRKRSESLEEYHSEYFTCAALSRLLRTGFSVAQPRVAVNTAGCLPYFSELPALDMLGLTDFHIAHHRPPDMGSGLLGHELGDGAYVLSRKPDLIVFCALGLIYDVSVPCFRSDREMEPLPDFSRYYRLVFYRADNFEMAIWTRMEDSRVGINRTDRAIYIPGFLLATTSGARSVLDANGELVTDLQSGDARIENISLPEGQWIATLKADDRSNFRLNAYPDTGVEALDSRTLSLSSKGELLSFVVSGDKGVIHAIVVDRK